MQRLADQPFIVAGTVHVGVSDEINAQVDARRRTATALAGLAAAPDARARKLHCAEPEATSGRSPPIWKELASHHCRHRCVSDTEPLGQQLAVVGGTAKQQL